MTLLPRLETIGRRRVLRQGRWLSIAYRPRVQRRLWLVALAMVVMIAIILPMGSYGIARERVWQTLIHPAAVAPNEALVIWSFRVPRILLAMVVGAVLAVAGACMQSVTRNGLADPGLIGTTEGAAIVMIAIQFFAPGLSGAGLPLLGMIGAALVAAIVLLLTRRVESVRFVLIGIGVSAFLSAILAVFVTYGSITQVQAALVWLAGSLYSASWKDLAILAPWGAVGIAVAFIVARETDAILLGEAAATGVGVRTGRARVTLIIVAVALTAASVAVVGPLGFVGLIAPHLSRFLIGGAQSALIGGSALCGAALVLLADSIGRLPFAPIQIPAGIVMAIIGVPFFLLLLWRRRNSL